MFLNPIIPAWLMAIVSILLLGIVLTLIFSQKRNLKGKIIKAVRFVLILVLLFVINLRPMLPSAGKQEVIMNNISVLFVVDNTISMYAEDYNGKETRMSGVKADIAYIMEELAGASFGVINFDDISRVLCPFTADTETVDDVLSVMTSANWLYAKGSSLNSPIDKMEEMFEATSKRAERRIICFFISDGEITDDSKLQSYKSLAKYLSGGAVLGYGTEKGGRMKANQDSEYEYYINDPDSLDDALSKIDEKNLNQIANDLEIDYIHMDRQSNVDKVLKPIKKLAVKESVVSKKSSGIDIYYYFVIPLLDLLIWKFIEFIMRI